MRLFCKKPCSVAHSIHLAPVAPPLPCRGGLMALRQMDDTNRRVWASSARHAGNPSVGVRRQLPLHKGAVFALARCACLGKESMTAQASGLPSAGAAQCRRAKKSPPCGGVAPLPYQGGLRSQANDSAGCCDRVREHRLAVPTRDREHRLGAAARRQSLSRRDAAAPLVQRGDSVAKPCRGDCEAQRTG